MIDPYLPKSGRRNPYFDALLKEGMNTSPIGAHSQGLSRLAFALLAGLERNDLERKEREATTAQLAAKQPRAAPIQIQGVPPSTDEY
jgi:hypothetical protein